MEMMRGFKGVFLAAALMVLILPATYAQTSTSPCTGSMISSFTPCINFVTNSTSSGTSPTTGCCNALRSLMRNGNDCLCQIVTGGVPFQVPINRTTAISLPRACNQPGVPIQCKAAAGAPVPAPGPAAFGGPGPSASPEGSPGPSASPEGSPAASLSPSPSSVGPVPTSEPPTLSPPSDANPTLTPPSTTEGGLPPTSIGSTPGTPSSLTPSAAMPSLSVAPAVLLLSVAVMIMKHF